MTFVSFGAKLYVTNTNDAGVGSLRGQIAVASPGDTVFIDVTGTLMVASQLDITQDLTIIGPGPIHFIINGTNLSGLAAMISPGGSSTVKIEGVKFEGGTHAAIGTNSGYLGLVIIKNCLFEAINNLPLSVDGGNIEVEGCSFVDNVSPNEAGACRFEGNTAKFTNCTFFNNDASFQGGALHLVAGSVDLINNTFLDNGQTMSGGTNARAIHVGAGTTVNIRNNIITQVSGSGINQIVYNDGGTINSQGGNVTRDNGSGDWTPAGNDLVNTQVTLGSMVTDGWGLKYFPYADNVSAGINIDNNPIGLPLYDQRRVWRVMDDGTGNEFADAGAVEYSPLTVTIPGGTSPGTLEDCFLSVYSSLVGKKAFVFEISGAGPHFCPSGFVVFDLNSQETILNGFSQNGSRVPGPGPNTTTVTNAITPIVINNAQGIPMAGLKVTGNNCVIAGVSIVDYGLGGSGINNDAFFTEIGGCHIGVLENGITQSSNEVGIDVSEFGSTKIGSGTYCGHLYHSNRNIISGNTNAQIAISGGEEQDIKHNFIGLSSDGIAKPTGSVPANDTGIALRPYISINNPNFIGGYDPTDYNVISGTYYGMTISTEGNFVLNNVIGGTLTGDAISNDTENYEGINLDGSSCANNIIGDLNAGNTIIGNYVGIQFSNGSNNNEVYGNHIGVSIYGDIPLGNMYEGVAISDVGCDNNKIGALGKGNVISANETGVWIANGAIGNSVLDNLIGLSGDGIESDMGNILNGIEVEGFGTDNNIIGSPGAGNFICFNGGHGIRLRTNQFHTIIQSNIIGLKTDTLTAAGNSNNGIYIDGDASHNLIGGCGVGEGNYIGNNGFNGIQMDFSGADYDTVYGNKIGLDVDFGNAGNIGDGILVSGGAGFIDIGNTSAGCGNEIAFNNVGITLDNMSSGVLISGNSIHDNIGLGIDIDADGTPDYTTDDGLSGNDATPIGVVSECIVCGGNTNFTITPESTDLVTYEVFKADGDSQEGDSLVYVWTGNVFYLQDTTISMPFALPIGMDLVITARINQSTSEFGPAFTVAAPPVALTPSITSNSICVGSSTPTLSTTGEVGTPVWFADAGMTIYVHTGNNYILEPTYASVPSSYTFYVADSVAGCYGAVSSGITLTVIDAPVRPISGPTSVCEGVVSELYSVTAVTGASYIWGFPTELPGEYSFNNNIQHNGSATNVVNTDFTSATSSGVNDTLFVSIDSAGCISKDTIFINVLGLPMPEPPSGLDPTTCGGTDGQVVYPIGLGTFDFYYNSGTLATVTSNGGGDSFITGLPQGVYAFDSVSNASGCYQYLTDTLELFDPLPPAIANVIQFDPTTCGGNDGSVIITLSPGPNVGPYTIDLDGGTTILTNVSNVNDTLFINGLMDGQVILNPVVTDEVTLCLDSYTYSGTLSDPLPPVADAGSDFTICESSSATLLGGPVGGGFTYSWDNGGGTTMNTTVTPSVTTTYTLTVTETATGCTDIDQADVFVNSLPVISGEADICFGNTLNIFPNSGGTWTANNPTDFTIDNAGLITAIGFGSGDFTFTDGNGCMNTSSVIAINPLPNEGNPFVTNVTCFGGSDGGIMLAPMGSYTHSWVGPNSFTASTQDISGVEAGSYSNTMTDISTGCTATYNGFVNQPASSPTFFASSTNLTCFNSGNGSITCTPGSGVGPYQFSNDGGGTYSAGTSFIGLSSGSYICNMMDANGCVSADTTIVITEPNDVLISPAMAEDTCARGVGEIVILATGGTGGPYQYSNNAGSSFIGSNTFSNLFAGNYDLIVEDGNGCSSTLTSVTINDLNGVQAFVFDFSSSVSCNGSTDGFIDISIGANPFGGEFFSWTEASSSFTASSEDVSSLVAGDYQVVVTDAGGCTDTVQVLITEPLILLASFGSTHETCDGLSDGSLFVQNISGGIGPYTTEWQTNPGGTSVGVADSLTNVSVDDYVGITTDANGCTVNGLVDVQIGEVYFPSVVIVSVIDSCINSNSFEFGDDNNVPPSGASNFSWTFTNGTPSISNIQNPSNITFNSPGTSLVNYDVTSNNGCVFNGNINVEILDTASVSLATGNISCNGLSDGIITASPVGGASPYQFSFNGGVFSSNNVFSNLNAGIYTVAVSDVNGCTSMDNSTIVMEPSPIDFDSLVVDASCGVNGSAEATNVSGGTPGYSIEWWTDSDLVTSLGTTNPLTGLTPNTYWVQIIDANGCETGGDVIVSNSGNTVPTPSIDQLGPLTFCEDVNANYGTVSVTSNLVTPGAFKWYVGTTGGTIASSGDTLGIDASNVNNNYIYVQEANSGGCQSAFDSILINFTANDLVMGADNTFCLGDIVEISATGSGTITWVNSNGEIEDTLSSVTNATPITDGTTYFAEMTFNGCSFIDSISNTLDLACGNTVITVNSFSPDGDGVNDVFELDIPILLQNDNTVFIVNRWGDVIREYKNYNNEDVAWDGTGKSGQGVTNGTYFYIVEIPELNFKESGWVQVVR